MTRNRSLMLGLGLMFTTLAAIAAYRMIAITQADMWAEEDSAYALQWIPGHPPALIAMCEQQLADGRIGEAQETARHLLSVAPLEGRGFRMLAEAAALKDDGAQALALYKIAARRSPRDTRTRAWLTEHYLVTADYRAALVHIDVLLRTSPRHFGTLLRLLAQLAVDPAFAGELARLLERRPEWRQALLSTLQNAKNPRGADNVMSALRAEGGLSESEFDEWIAFLMRQGRWGEAYGRWAGTLDLKDAALPLVFNGDFEQPVTGRGFDWRLTRIPGVSLEFVRDGDAKGLSAHATFSGRRVAQANLEQQLLLAPGSYRFTARIRADALRSDRGLEWVVVCSGPGDLVATSERLDGTFEWRTIDMVVDIPITGCPAQLLMIRNPVLSGSAQQVSGDIWMDDVSIHVQRR